MSIINDELFESYKKYDTYKNLKEKDKIDELSEENKNKFIIKVFNNFFNYLSSIDINNNNDIFKFIFNKYLNHKASGKSDKDFVEIIDKLIINNITSKYFGKILNLYYKIKNVNLIINHYCLFFIYKIILLLFSYHIYIEHLFYEYNKNKNIKYDLINNINYKQIINFFRIEFLDKNDNDKHLNIFAIKKIDLNIKNNPDYNIFYKLILKYIQLLQDVYKEPKLSHYKKEYITIPQYMGNCWYIAMLTCITYSDLSKKLILSKIGDEAKKNKLISSSKLKSNRIFINTVDNIIKNITINHKKYGDDIYSNCNNLKYLKEHVMDYIYQKYYELKSTNKFKASLDTFYGNNNFYYKALNYKINTNPNHKEINKNKLLTNEIVHKYDINVGANITYANLIINSLYNVFNISTLYLYDYIHSSNYLRQQKIEYDSDTTLKSPDIIFIHKKDIHPFGNFISFDKNKITKLDKDTILYNKCKYKLDFILHSTDNNNTCTGCSHCIAGIHYNGEQYYHDSAYTDIALKCDSKLVEIPCTLIHQNWVNDIDKADTYLKSKNYPDIKDLCLFNIQKCFHKLTDITSQNLNKNIINEYKRCFNNLYNLIYGYVKIDDNSPLFSEKKQQETEIKLKSSGIKVNIMNNNKIIKRIIYLDKNKNKYIKLNKDYILLSNLTIYDNIYHINEQKEEKKEKKEIFKSSGVKIDIINKKKVIKRIIYLDKNKNKYIKLNKEYELLSNLKYSGTFYYK